MTARRVIGGLILALAGIPALFGAIMVSGMTWAMFENWFSEARVRQVTNRIPKSAEAVWQSIQKKEDIEDPATKAWIEAMRKTKPSPVEVAKQAGIFTWLETEIPRAFGELGDIVKGKKAPHRVVIHTTPLRDALTGPLVKDYIKKLFLALPSCEPDQVIRWQRLIESNGQGSLPACNPGAGMVSSGVDLAAVKFAPKKDEFPIMDSPHMKQSRRIRMGRTMMWILLLAALFLILVGSAIGGLGLRGFLRWAGTSTLLGAVGAAVLALGLGAIVEHIWATDPSSWDIQTTQPFWNTAVGHEVLRQMAWFFDAMFSDLFSAVAKLAGMICLLGIGLLAASFFTPKPRQA